MEKAHRMYADKLTKYKITNSKCFLDWIGYAVVDKCDNWSLVKVPYNPNNDSTDVKQEKINNDYITHF